MSKPRPHREAAGASAPAASRPRGKRYWDPSLPPALPWLWAERRLETARNYWVVATRPDGRPYSRPVWGVWLEGTFVFDSSSLEPNLLRDPRVEVHLESGEEVVVFKGVAEKIDDRQLLERLIAAYNPKYRWNWAAGNTPRCVWRVRPRAAFGWLIEKFGSSGTRWTFEDG